MARKTLSDKGVAALKARPQRYAYADPELRGHYVRVQPSGQKTFVTVTRGPDGKQVWATVGAADAMSIEQARSKARDMLTRVRDGLAPVEPKAETFGAVAAQWLRRHVEKNALRSARNIELLLASHVLPLWKNKEFAAIRRSDVAALLDEVEDGHSARQADAVLTVIRSIMNWYAVRHDGYGPPIVRGMRRQSPKAQQRARTLDDDELKLIWQAAEDGGVMGDFVRLALLTAQRRAVVAGMRRADISEQGLWQIPKAAREKDNAGAILLPPIALAIIQSRPQINEFVFAGRADRPINGFGKLKLAFDRKLPQTLPGWTLHDLRRTSRSLMSRAGVAREVAERVLGHVQPGIEATYDRFDYRDQKADALRKLAALIEQIVRPQANVLPMRGRPQ